jgi:hypothetical protein
VLGRKHEQSVRRKRKRDAPKLANEERLLQFDRVMRIRILPAYGLDHSHGRNGWKTLKLKKKKKKLKRLTRAPRDTHSPGF